MGPWCRCSPRSWPLWATPADERPRIWGATPPPRRGPTGESRRLLVVGDLATVLSWCRCCRSRHLLTFAPGSPPEKFVLGRYLARNLPRAPEPPGWRCVRRGGLHHVATPSTRCLVRFCQPARCACAGRDHWRYHRSRPQRPRARATSAPRPHMASDRA